MSRTAAASPVHAAANCPPPPRRQAELAYDGGAYVGYQLQPNGDSVQARARAQPPPQPSAARRCAAAAA